MKTSLFLRRLVAATAAATLPLTTSASTLVSDFEDTGLPAASYNNGADGSAGFLSHHVRFNNRFVDWGFGVSSWSGFSASRINNPTTPGYGNQYAVWGEGPDVSGAGTYAVAFVDETYGVVPTMTLPCPSLVRGFYVNNTAYAALAIRDGDYPARAFSTTTGDWFRLTITGRDESGTTLGTVEVYLADFRARPFILDRWRWVDVTALGPTVRTLEFRVASTDNGTWGMNTPAYFAMDGLEFLPQPSQTVASLDALPAIPAGTNYWNGSDLRGGFRDSAVLFSNTFDTVYQSWYGFALSRVEAPNVPGWLNQYAVWGDGKDVSGDGQYAVAFDASWDPDADQIVFPYDVRVAGFHVNNTAYAALAMRNGESPSKKFGGTSGNDADWFKLVVTAKSADGDVLGTEEFYLADYRFANNASDYILSDWTWVDLSLFEPGVRSLHFALSSSDNHPTYGMNTPAYFALDGLTYGLAAGGAHDNAGSALDQGIPGFVQVEGVDVPNPVFVGWATEVVSYAPAPGLDPVWESPALALGPVTSDIGDVAVLGDLTSQQLAANVPAGTITLGFETPVRDGNGPDFAVFENGFASDEDSSFFAELAYVEVSSDGVHFARLPSASDTLSPVLPYGGIRARNVWNLAGKHSNGYGESYGTPFDLADLAGDPLVRSGFVDLGRITQVRIVDIPGDGSRLDSRGQPIYDAWPTWGSGGFDLEAIGVLNAVLPGATDRHVAWSWITDQRLVGTPTEAQELDLDNDGQTAWEEFYGGTDANDPSSLLQVTGVTNANGTLTVTWQGSRRGSDLPFTLLQGSSLSEGNWFELDVPRAAGNTQSWNGAPPVGDAAFFRVLVKAPEPIIN